MTEGSGMPLGFCQFCGAGQIIPGQGHCAECGQKLLQASEIVAATAAAPAPTTPGSAPDVVAPAAAQEPLPPTYPYPTDYGQPPTFAQWSGAQTYPPMAPPTGRNRSILPIVVGIGLVLVLAVVVLVGGFYVATSSKSTPGAVSSNPVAANGSPAAAPPATAAASAAPQVTTGTLTGQVLSTTGNGSVPGVGEVLCLKSASSCTVDLSLKAISDASGSFKISDVPVGSYVVLYTQTGAPGPGVDGLKVDLDDQSASCIASGFLGKAPASCQGSIPLLAADGGLKLLGNAKFSLAGSGMSLQTGTLYSPKLGLSLSFVDGKPLGADITAGGTATIQINYQPAG